MEEIDKRTSDQSLVEMASRGAPPIGSRWKHLKTGGVYQVLLIGLREEDGTPAVAYRKINTELTWFRPVAQFTDGRFERIL